jgi:hypothetical protein
VPGNASTERHPQTSGRNLVAASTFSEHMVARHVGAFSALYFAGVSG